MSEHLDVEMGNHDGPVIPRLELLIPAEQIQTRVADLADQISHDYADKPITLIGIMTGCLPFLADLSKQLQIPHQIGVLQASSYHGTSTTPGQLRINCDFLPALANRHALLVDDILDTGHTLHAIQERIAALQPASLKTAVLLWKQSRTVTGQIPDYTGFPIDDHFVVGYGLDFNENHRHLPGIYRVE